MFLYVQRVTEKYLVSVYPQCDTESTQVKINSKEK